MQMVPARITFLDTGRRVVPSLAWPVFCLQEAMVPDSPVVIAENLAPEEVARLEKQEAIIARGLRTFVDVGNALLAIRDGRLYRATHQTFEDYCRDRWGFTDRRARMLMDASGTVANLESGTIVPLLPANEAQTRPLAPLSPGMQRVAWEMAVVSAPNGKVTAEHVQAVVNELVRDRQGDAERIAVYQPVAVTMFSSRSDEYYTPAEHVEAARAVLGAIDLDPASCEMAQATVRAGRFYTKDDDGLAQPWSGRVFLNPPYGTTAGQSNQGTWAQRLVEAYRAGKVTAGILLVKAALGYEWFESLWYDWPVCFPRQRLSFMLPDGNDDGQSKQASAIFYFGPDVDRFTEIFRRFGRVIMPESA